LKGTRRSLAVGVLKENGQQGAEDLPSRMKLDVKEWGDTTKSLNKKRTPVNNQASLKVGVCSSQKLPEEPQKEDGRRRDKQGKRERQKWGSKTNGVKIQ